MGSAATYEPSGPLKTLALGNRLTETRGGLTDTYTYQPNGAGGRTAVLQQITLGVGGTRDYWEGRRGPRRHLRS